MEVYLATILRQKKPDRMKQLRNYRYIDIISNGYYEKYYDPAAECEHIRRLIGDTGKYIYMSCERCGDVRQIINPNYIPYFIKEKKAATNKKEAKLPEPLRLDAVDRYHAQKQIEKYEGDLRKDLLQPYNPDGSPNQEFIKTYGYLP